MLETVDIYPIQFMPVIRTLSAVPDDVLITGIHCIIVGECIN